MATAEQVKQMQAGAIELRGLSAEALAQNTRWGALSFMDVIQEIRLIITLGTHLGELPVEYIPDNEASTILDALTTARQVIDHVSRFELVTGNNNPLEARNNLAGQLRNAAPNLLRVVKDWIPFLAYQKGDIQKNIAELSQAIVDARGALDGANTYATIKKGEVEGIITAAREAAAKVGVGHFTADFEGEAIRLETAASSWLKITGGLAVATLVVALALTQIVLPQNASAGEVAHLISSKLIVLLVLMTATVWCGRLYKATKHQAVTNHHRASALKTFEAFVKSASDPATRDAVLMETTRSIIAIGPSGYLDTSEPAADSGTKVLEIFKGAKAS